MAHKFNPFRPNQITPPGMFCGRINEIMKIERGLFQTKHRNPYHFILEGERGLGKSSLFFYLSNLAAGRIQFEDLNLNMMVVSVELREEMDFDGIVDEILLELKKEIGTREQIKELCKKAWGFLSRLEVYGVGLRSADGRPREHRLEELTTTLVDVLADAGDTIDGILILVDEAGAPSAAANLGELCKLLTERLTKRHCERVSLGLAGLPGLTTTLRESHQSSPRVFQLLPLAPLEYDERKEVVRRGLAVVEEKTGLTVGITDEALNAIANLSEGYPHFLQEFAYYAFESDADNSIDYNDVMEGAFQENGALDQLGQKYFSELYIDQIGSEDYRKVLSAMAKSLDGWVNRQEIIKRAAAVGVNEKNVDNALRALRDRKIIVAKEGVRGEYRLPTKSFAVWIRAKEAARQRQQDRGGNELFGPPAKEG